MLQIPGSTPHPNCYRPCLRPWSPATGPRRERVPFHPNRRGYDLQRSSRTADPPSHKAGMIPPLSVNAVRPGCPVCQLGRYGSALGAVVLRNLLSLFTIIIRLFLAQSVLDFLRYSKIRRFFPLRERQIIMTNSSICSSGSARAAQDWRPWKEVIDFSSSGCC